MGFRRKLYASPADLALCMCRRNSPCVATQTFYQEEGRLWTPSAFASSMYRCCTASVVVPLRILEHSLLLCRRVRPDGCLQSRHPPRGIVSACRMLRRAAACPCLRSLAVPRHLPGLRRPSRDRKSTRLNSSHLGISY